MTAFSTGSAVDVVAFDSRLSSDKRNANSLRLMRHAIAQLDASRQSLSKSIAGMDATVGRLETIKAAMVKSAQPHRQLLGMIEQVEALVTSGRYDCADKLVATLTPADMKAKRAVRAA